MRNKIITLLLVALTATNIVMAQAGDAMSSKPVEMADGMRSNGKIFVVVAVLVIILAGIVLFLINLERKISRLEKENK